MKVKFILFDMDGTLSESAPGITKCVQYALRCLGIEEEDRSNLLSFVGPPLNVEFQRRYGLDPEQTEYAVKKYREMYGKDGIFDCRIYDGMTETLAECSGRGQILGVASSKPQPHVIRILDNFDIRKYFSVIVGSSPDEEINKAGADQKKFIVGKALEEMKKLTDPETGRPFGSVYTDEEFRDACAMVGDRLYDMQGAKANNIHAVGAAYGYGSVQELKDSGAEYIAGSPAELGRLFADNQYPR